MAPVPIGFDPMLAATCFASVFVPEALFVVFCTLAVAAVVFLAVLPLAFRYGNPRQVRRDADRQPVRRRRSLADRATSDDVVPVAGDRQAASLASDSGSLRSDGAAPIPAAGA